MIRGKYRDVLIKPDQSVIYDSGWHSNHIVEECYAFLSYLTMGQNGGNNMDIDPFGICAMRLGQGEEPWDPEIPRAEPIKDLINPYDLGEGEDKEDKDIAIGPDNIEPIYKTDETDKTVIGLRATVIIAAGVPKPQEGSTFCPLREFGLFGRVGNNIFMVNYVKHYLIEKEQSTPLIRTVELEFFPSVSEG